MKPISKIKIKKSIYVEMAALFFAAIYAFKINNLFLYSVFIFALGLIAGATIITYLEEEMLNTSIDLLNLMKADVEKLKEENKKNKKELNQLIERHKND